MPAYKVPLTPLNLASEEETLAKFGDALRQAQEKAGSMAMGMQGFVINSRNALTLLDALKSALPREPVTPSEIAKAYLSIKYPKLFSKANAFNLGLEGNNLGEYTPGFRNIRIQETFRDPTQAIQTGGHELTHLLHEVRETKLPKYIPYSGFRKALDPVFWYQPAEVYARRGGRTAQKSFMKLLDLLKVSREPQSAVEILGLKTKLP